MGDVDLTLDRDRLERVRRTAAVVVDRPAVFRVCGPGTLACLQGLFTNDLEKPGDESLVYGATSVSAAPWRAIHASVTIMPFGVSIAP